jgi:hypothetical protein
MPYTHLPGHIRALAKELLDSSKIAASTGQAGLAGAYRSASDAIARGDEVGAQLWREKADVERHALELGA